MVVGKQCWIGQQRCDIMGGMDREAALGSAHELHKAIADAEAEAKRIVEEARIAFGAKVNELVENKDVHQEDVADRIGKTREYVRRLQVKARNAQKRGE